jgi:hypothetical protein
MKRKIGNKMTKKKIMKSEIIKNKIMNNSILEDENNRNDVGKPVYFNTNE